MEFVHLVRRARPAGFKKSLIKELPPCCEKPTRRDFLEEARMRALNTDIVDERGRLGATLLSLMNMKGRTFGRSESRSKAGRSPLTVHLTSS